MTKDIANIKGLAHVADVALRAAQADMAQLMRREADLRRNLAQLTQSKSTLAQSKRRSDDAALIAGADMRWHHWVDQRRATINTELAQVLALKDTCRTKLRLAFGREQAASGLLTSAILTAETIKRRRADYES